MDKLKLIAVAVYKNPKVRLAAKGLLLAVAAVIGDFYGIGSGIIESLAK